MVFGIRAGLLAFLGYERFVLANSTGLMSTNVLSVSLRERLMLMFRPSVWGGGGKFTIRLQGGHVYSAISA